MTPFSALLGLLCVFFWLCVVGLAALVYVLVSMDREP